MSLSIEQLHGIDSSRIKPLPLYKLKFKKHLEYPTNDDGGWVSEVRDIVIEVSCPAGWAGANDVAKYIHDSHFIEWESGMVDLELVAIEKVETPILGVDVEKLMQLREWLKKNAEKKAQKKTKPTAQEDFS